MAVFLSVSLNWSFRRLISSQKENNKNYAKKFFDEKTKSILVDTLESQKKL